MKAIAIFVFVGFSWGSGADDFDVDVNLGTSPGGGVSIQETISETEMLLLQAMVPEMKDLRNTEKKEVR